ncbi:MULTISPECIES: bifunctional 1-(5-phosphoribosyl)-5-((5-phosphoribosylamino)methylideneamino)imidazole-4-carboxamide isomerase/phosphoribosylanthranilate isomerase PriA [Auritidibacter]|uniref:1-(5-phosphoribosyl)-5-[(5-phosphoribosylamino)methylideneamino] imidazole-4-carboxamide isomerase n=1 Tax=Auritidibacter ignavus TaxID=678932 RepID=A0AAJ6AIT5_9MICC|nr:MULTISPECIES: bifunctional 1-(5-phosphoribosyl)-5-((5-phosphoribosylamino)methylideneamino)imidazole-4-carboxamide isomerase/phosphoribosylanthranilate isomerase PriA [Auritidibacter]PXA81174.1 bifunctional 1-(5-phosphoribosyl)-5-((5-phosphoribosylamino)methylideneamino)imidazole-4-carboxamide isomerase/phosphoribosylanthranilate isomerase PriA [Auritidibacter sp. NML120779]AXR73777.1 bifunctional 1-(5-phosphoribosyl)-5-((5-phosphoribosylamino)methylideneamino)imidazole-4-carboxamide isomerase
MSERSTSLTLFPAVDIKNGQAVRLVKGEADQATDYGNPLQAARRWAEAGAEWIHLVDLDAAFGTGDNRQIIRDIVTELQINVEVSGGLRDDASLDEAITMGAARVNLGTAALERPGWTAEVIARYGEKIAVGLDVRGEELATRGWVQSGGNLWEVLDTLEQAGCDRYVVTDITKDGTLTGPNTELLASIVERVHKPVVASGGISTLDDLATLYQMSGSGVDGAIIGKALYSGQFTFQQALAVAGGADPAQVQENSPS